MKAVFLLALLALAILAVTNADRSGGVHPCDPHGDGKPCYHNKCCHTLGFFRNNHNPATYWECYRIYEEPLLRPCPPKTLFDPVTRRCIHANEWENKPVCP